MLFRFTAIESRTVHLKVHACVCVLSHIWLFCHPMDRSPPGSSFHGISQAATLEWATITSSKGSSSPSDRTSICFRACTGRQIPYHYATCEAHSIFNMTPNKLSCTFSCLISLRLLFVVISKAYATFEGIIQTSVRRRRKDWHGDMCNDEANIK